MAYEDFKSDTIVDISPYTPASWSADYGKYVFDIKKDTTGFVLDTSGAGERLIYKHKAGAQYPVTCQVVPYTNLQWRDYEFSGKITKPAGAVYDSVWVGVDVYSGNGKQYRFMFRNDTMMVSGGGISEIVPDLNEDFDHGDSLFFKIRIVTDSLQIGGSTYPDSTIDIKAYIGINTTTLDPLYENSDVSSSHIKYGYPAIMVDLYGKEDHATSAIKIEDIRVQKYAD